jgi:hypothetical protein
MECEFCKKTFISLSSLNKHKNTAKYCLDIQGKEKKELDIILCEYCDKTFTIDKSFQKHINNCKVKKLCEENIKLKEIIEEHTEYTRNIEEKHQDEISIYKNKIKNLEDELRMKDNENIELKTSLKIYKESDECLKEIAKQPKNTTKNTTNKNTTNNLLYMPVLNLDKDIIKSKIKNNFTKNHLKDGQHGVACFAVDNLLKDDDDNFTYICTDPSRQMFSFKNKDGTIEKDFKANKLTKLISEDVIKQATTLTDDKIETNIKLSEIRELKKDNSKFSNKLSNLLYKPGEIDMKYITETTDIDTDSDSEDDNYTIPEPGIEYYRDQLRKINEMDDGVSIIYSAMREQIEAKLKENNF